MNVLALTIAGVRVDLEVPDTAPGALDRYRPFAGGEGPPAWTIQLLRPAASASPWTPGRAVLPQGGRWVVAGAEEAAWLDPPSGRGAAAIDPELLLLDALIRAAVAEGVLSRGGLLVHGAALAVDGAAHVFPARSGAGKSTLASRARHPLSDEISVILPASAGFVAHASPWWRTRGGSAPVAGVYTLAWDGEGVSPLRRTAVRQLVTNLVLPLDTPVNRGRALAAAAAVAGAVPFARFAFRPQSDVDQLLRARSR